MRSAPSKDVPPHLNVRTRPVDARAGYANRDAYAAGRLGSAINSSGCSGLMATAPVDFLPPVGASYSDQGTNPETWEGVKEKPTARFASGGGFETLLVLLAVSDLAGSAHSLGLNNAGGHRRGNGRHRHDAGANRDGEKQTHASENSTECGSRKG